MELKEKLANYALILASQSPRRQELLGDLDIPFEIWVKPGLDESYPENLEKEEIVCYLAKHKAQAYLAELTQNQILITSDTIVWIDGEVLGKPENEEDARNMIRKLSGREHLVLTGVSLSSTEKQISFYDISKVQFKNLTNKEIDYYVTKYKPLDKAGAYGIQEWIGYIGIERIEGSYFNIMGLPVHRLYSELLKFLS